MGADALAIVRNFDPVSIEGEVGAVSGLAVEVSDRLGALQMHTRVEIEMNEAPPLLGEVVSLSKGSARVLPFGPLDGIRRGARVKFLNADAGIRPSAAFLGRIVNGLGQEIDGKGPIKPGVTLRSLKASPASAPRRARLGAPVDFGVKAINSFTPARAGQRLGVFSGSGVGKSGLLAMIARHAECDISIIALIGERGREVRDFIEDHLGEAGLARSVVIVATSDEPAMMRREAAYLALTLSEYFRDCHDGGGNHVLCLMDSLTRIAMAQRELGLASGEPPTTKGYTPSVFSILPALVERAGPGLAADKPGFITGVFSVLVEGDDLDEPIADTARAILDGHIVLDRSIAESGRFPAIDILRSVSRVTAPGAEGERQSIMRAARRHAAAYAEMRELIRIGAYRTGASLEIDRAIEFHPELESFLSQPMNERVTIDDGFVKLREILPEIGAGVE